ncbi:hypothetical protein D3C78_1721300 [compost metagenome]|jgi:hypothetical protein
MLFGERHAGGSATKSGRLSETYLNKHDNLTVFHDQINFAATSVNVSGDKTQSFAFQPATRF